MNCRIVSDKWNCRIRKSQGLRHESMISFNESSYTYKSFIYLFQLSFFSFFLSFFLWLSVCLFGSWVEVAHFTLFTYFEFEGSDPFHSNYTPQHYVMDLAGSTLLYSMLLYSIHSHSPADEIHSCHNIFLFFSYFPFSLSQDYDTLYCTVDDDAFFFQIGYRW